MVTSTDEKKIEEPSFTGNVFIYFAFDVGEEINLDKLSVSGIVKPQHLNLSKYFKNYHVPLAIEIPPGKSSACHSIKLHNFGALSLTYKIPFESSLEDLRQRLLNLNNSFEQQSVSDANFIYKKIKKFITNPNFFYTKSSYVVIQVDTGPKKIDTIVLKEQFGSIIASALRFETKSLSEYQKNEILASSIGYFKGDLIVIDTEAAFIYDPEYEEVLDFFEFGNIQHLELRYFDRILDNYLTIIYEEKARKVPIKAYLPFVGTLSKTPVDELAKLKVDISVISERLESSIKLVGESYYSELYAMLSDKLDLPGWKETVEKKLSIVHDIRSVLQQKVDSIREDLLTVLIIVLILTEIILGLMK